MTVYIVISAYLPNFCLGVYSSIKKARMALEYHLSNTSDIVSWEDVGDYNYQFTTWKGENFGAEIIADRLDLEFEGGFLSEMP